MKVALELPPHMGTVEIHLAQLRGQQLFLAKSQPLVFEQSNEFIWIKHEPWLTVSRESLIEFHRSLTAELKRLGLIRPTPSEEEIASLTSQLKDAKEVRDKCLGIIKTQLEGIKHATEKREI